MTGVLDPTTGPAGGGGQDTGADERTRARSSLRAAGTFPALDGLRILAVTAVVATHVAFRTGRYTVGFGRAVLSHLDIGVAIFFVISGFLISREWLTPDRVTGGRPRLAPYAWHRVLRIMPMYWVSLVVVLAAVPGNRGEPAGEWVRQALLLQTYGTAHLLVDFTQVWSLCTEAAFYAVLPAIAWVVLRVARTRDRVPAVAAATAVVLGLASLVWVGWFHTSGAAWTLSAGYWLPTTGSWFAAGLWLAAVRIGADDPTARRRAHWRAVDRLGDQPGVCLLIGGCAFAVAVTPIGSDSLDPFPSSGQAVAHAVLYLVTAVALVLPAVLGGGAAYDAVLGQRVLRYLGRISYSVFLLHLLVLHAVAAVLDQPLFTGSFLGIFAVTWLVSIPVAALGYHLVERPALRLRNRRLPGRRRAEAQHVLPIEPIEPAGPVPTAPAPRRRTLLPVLAVPASVVLGNGLAYALLLAAARVLTHAHYGSFVALTTIVVVGAVPSLALQAVTARRVAGGEGTAGLARVTWALALGSAGLLAALTVPLDAFLHIDSPAATLWLAAGLVPLTLLGPLVGAAQGAERMVAFAGMSLLQAVGRFGGCLLPLLLVRTEAAALAGAAVGMALAVVVGRAVAARCGLALPSRRERAAVRPVLLETAHALHGYAAILVLTSADLLLARHVVSGEQAAQYAAGSVVSKAVVWLPQSIGLIVFARMASRERHLAVVRRALAAVAGLGLLATAGCAVFSGLVARLVGGGFSVLSSSAWIFALLGTCLAVLQFTMVAGLAARTSRRLIVLWAALAGEVVVVLSMPASASAAHVAGAVTGVAAVAAAAGVWLAARAPSPSR